MRQLSSEGGSSRIESQLASRISLVCLRTTPLGLLCRNHLRAPSTLGDTSRQTLASCKESSRAVNPRCQPSAKSIACFRCIVIGIDEKSRSSSRSGTTNPDSVFSIVAASAHSFRTPPFSGARAARETTARNRTDRFLIASSILSQKKSPPFSLSRSYQTS